MRCNKNLGDKQFTRPAWFFSLWSELPHPYGFAYAKLVVGHVCLPLMDCSDLEVRFNSPCVPQKAFYRVGTDIG